ncbi:membrane-associated protein, putative [Bodo saltans]|uniref:Membrane-associated protein, putative n=1 Tax=Bodo saltans TaxID=75058 RepID=A0A0S4IUT8_BODSA|nr:membrane-associated protein, putative [Bodo saltans]|eukprot:CUF96582.1 membrane-associated protein, putative [Bodo saltans]
MLDVVVDWVLSLTLWFVTYIQPIVLGARVCRAEHAKPAQVMNITLAVVFVWLTEFLDSLILGRIFAMRWLYTAFRIALAWYWMHPRLLGALKTYQKYLLPMVERHAGTIDSLITDHINEARHSGSWKYVLNLTGAGAKKISGAVHSALDVKQE